jgi:hypothetical protein
MGCIGASIRKTVSARTARWQNPGTAPPRIADATQIVNSRLRMHQLFVGVFSPVENLLYSLGTMRFPTVLFVCLACLPSTAQKVPTNRYPVVIVNLENHPYSSLYLSSSMPNLTALTKQYGVAQNFDANGHYSIGNYMFQTFGKSETTDDAYNPDTSGYFSDDNIVRHLIGLGSTYKMYQESIDSAGSTEMVSANGLYVRRHNPLSYTSEFGQARPVIEITDSNKKNPQYVITSPANVTSKTWTSMTLTYTVPAGKAFVRVYMEMKAPTQKSEARFDDISLQIQ